MSAYRNFVTDFPNRCKDVLESLTAEAEKQDREVTLMLMVAASGFLAPFERLKPPTGRYTEPHRDRREQPRQADELERLLLGTVRDAQICDEHLDEWWYGGLHGIDDEPDSWPELRNPPVLSPDERAGNVIFQIRNSLAHGNIEIFPSRRDVIEKLVFVARNNREYTQLTQDYVFAIATPAAFRAFLLAWFASLDQWKITQDLLTDRLGRFEAA